MILTDIHMHSSFSSDSEAPMESMVQGAIGKGLKTICFTEHLDYDYPVREGAISPLFIVDLDAYQKKCMEVKEKYKSEIEILFGIEMGLMPYLSKRYQKDADKYPFDYIIGSSHLVNGADPYEPYFWETRDEKTAYGEYFQTIIDNIKNFKSFNTYGHIDYIVRYGPDKNNNYSYEKYSALIDEILHLIIENGLSLEVNTAGYKYGLGQPNPQADILMRYRQMGGERISIGADAHKPEHIAYDFDKAENLLKACGFKYHTLFKERKPVMIPLD